MNTAYVYLQLYKLFDHITPVKTDCGQLCGSACCSGDDCGMFLFPGELSVYQLLSPEWALTEPSDFSYTHQGKQHGVPLLFCQGECDRFQRPLSCRIFPLTPVLNDSGNLEIIVDPRSKGICPMGRAMHVADFDPAFVRNIYRAFSLLCKNKQFYSFMTEYTAYIREFQRFFRTDI